MTDSTMEPTPQHYGFYSEESAWICGTHIYNTPSGKPVEVSTVTTDPEGQSFHWPDKVCVGVVTNKIRDGKSSSLLE